jgi:polyferredoxin
MFKPIKLIRLFVRHLSFVVLTYGGQFGLNLGNSLPCLSCPYIPTCGGVCYLRFLQNPFGGLALPWPLIFTWRGLMVFAAFVLFLALVAVFGQSWCGWFCPFGLFQDWLTGIRQKLKIREAVFSARAALWLKTIKYALLAYLLLSPVLIAKGIFHPDLSPPFCSICPVKIVMPLFAGDATWLSLDFTNNFLLVMSVLLILITGLTLVGAFFKERFFCLICPMSALIGFFKFLSIFRLVKEPMACQGCGTCGLVCPLEIDSSRLIREKRQKETAQTPGLPAEKAGAFKAQECQGCFICAESCASDGSFSIKLDRKSVV